jgi:hypothetical protein
MEDLLQFNADNYEVKECERDGIIVTYRAFTDITYCANPVSDVQKLNLFVPEKYYHGAEINGYSLKSAPIFIPNTVGGYMEGRLDEPGVDFLGRTNTIFKALNHGYVVVAPGIRGRNTGLITKEFFVGGKADDCDKKSEMKKEKPEFTGTAVGRAPALIVDMKAVVRYLRHNELIIPGNTDRIITSGTSAGGALSSLAGATGNSADYEPYLKAIGAADARDDIYGANCYCPIHNLENADAAYEWLFNGQNEYHKMRFENVDGKVKMTPEVGTMSDSQVQMSSELKRLFPSYVNGLGLKDSKGNTLTLDENGEGSFKEYVKEWVIKAAQSELESHDSGTRLYKLAVPGSEIDDQEYITTVYGKVSNIDWDAYVSKITRMKTTPAFDAVDLDSPENEEFGDDKIFARHFTNYSQEHDANGNPPEIAEDNLIKMLNPTKYIGEADTSKYWRIRHGAFDRDTAIAIPVILATMLMNRGYEVDFALPWGLPHSGDYDTDEMFKWIDEICKDKK